MIFSYHKSDAWLYSTLKSKNHTYTTISFSNFHFISFFTLLLLNSSPLRRLNSFAPMSGSPGLKNDKEFNESFSDSYSLLQNLSNDACHLLEYESWRANWILRNCEIKKFGFCGIKNNLDFAKSTFLIAFIKSGFCEIKKSGFCEMNQLSENLLIAATYCLLQIRSVQKIWILRNEKNLDFVKSKF